jgi:hypothetical protein
MRAIILIMSIAFACGCATRTKDELPVFASIIPANAPLVAGESIKIALQTPRRHLDLTGVVDADGMIPFLLGVKVHVGGLTPTEAAKKIEQAFINICIPDRPNDLPARVEVSRQL